LLPGRGPCLGKAIRWTERDERAGIELGFPA
jgi:hypothetical protein